MIVELDVHSQDYVFTIIHCISVIGTIINLFGLYTILVYSPKEMGEYSKALACLQVTATVSDHIFGDGCCPFLLFPLIGGVPYGWMPLVGLSTEFLTGLGIAVLGHTQTCTVYLFLLRLQFIVPMNHPLKMKPALKYAFFLLLNIAPYLHSMWFLSVIHNHDNKQATNDYYRQKYPELVQFIALDTFFGTPPEMNFFFFCNICSFVVICGTLMISLSCLCFYLLRIQEEYLDIQLVQEERKLIKALVTQITIPMITVIIPCIFSAVIFILDQAKYTKYCLIIILCISQHGLANTIALLLLYRPYRVHLKRALWKLSKWLRVPAIVEKWLGPKVSTRQAIASLSQRNTSNCR